MYLRRCVNKSKLSFCFMCDEWRQKHVKTAFWACILQQVTLDYFEIISPVSIST